MALDEVEVDVVIPLSTDNEEFTDSARESHESRNEQPNNDTNEVPVGDLGLISATSKDSKKVSRQDIEFVQNLIERCLQLYMNSDEVVKTLLTRARIDPGFTTLVWRKLEEENADFFRAYYIRLKLKKQILLFNHLLGRQYHLMKYDKVPVAPIHNGFHPMSVNNLPMGYPLLQHHPMQMSAQPSLNPIGGGISNCHINNGVPAPSNFHPIRMIPGNDMGMDSNGNQVDGQVMPMNVVTPAMAERPTSPASAASSGHFPFTASELSGMAIAFSTFEVGFPSDVVHSEGLQLVPDGGSGNSRDALRRLDQDQIQWNFSLSDLTADLSNLADLGALGNYPGSPFLPSDSDILLASSEHDDLVEEFFVDSVPGPPFSQSDEERS